MYDYDEHKAEARGAGDNILKQLSSLALDQKRAELEVAQAEEQLALAKAKLAHIAEHVIPELMDAAEMAEYTTKDGIKIKINEKVRGSIPKATEAQAFQWLLDNRHDDLIKREFKIQFGKNEEAWAKEFEQDLQNRKRPLAFDLKRTVHASTLASFVKSQLEAGVDFPMDLFGVYRQRTSVIDVKE
jgi:hypothetical protein